MYPGDLITTSTMMSGTRITLWLDHPDERGVAEIGVFDTKQVAQILSVIVPKGKRTHAWYLILTQSRIGYVSGAHTFEVISR